MCAPPAAGIDEALYHERLAWWKKRRDWLPEGKPWIDDDAARMLAALDLDPARVNQVLRDARASRLTLDNPAAFIIARLTSTCARSAP